MFSETKIPIPSTTYPLDITQITAKVSDKYVRKCVCPTEMLLVELIKFFQPERNKKQSRKQEKSNTKFFQELKYQGVS